MTLPSFTATAGGRLPGGWFSHHEMFRFQDGGYWYQNDQQRLPPRVRCTTVTARYYRTWALKNY